MDALEFEGAFVEGLGVAIYAGTDAGGALPHGLVAREVVALHVAGMPAAEALAAASWRAREWLGFTGKEDMVMYGSSYPHWQLNELTVPAAYSDDQRNKLCWRNAAELYGIDVGAGVSAK